MRFALLPIPFLCVSLAAQQTLALQESPAASVTQHLGLTRLEITYHRPAVKGRSVWGSLVPFDRVWRAGANEATTFSTSTPVKVAGKELPAGTYALFALPRKDRWTLIFNRQSKQWGSFFRNPEDDVLSLDVTPEVAPHQEWFAFGIDLKDRRTAWVTMAWEKMRVGFPVEADVDGLYQAYLVEELKKAETSTDPKRWNTWFLAAQYRINRQERLDEADALLAKCAALTEHFRVCEWQGRLRQLQGRLPEAIALVEKAKALAPAAGAPKEYVAGLDALMDGWKAGK